MILALNIRRSRWSGETRKTGMELEFEPHPENGYDLGSLKEGMIFQDRVMLN